MKRMWTLCVVFVFAGGLSVLHGTKPAATAAAGREFSPLQLEKQIPVPQVAGRLDHFSADAKRRRLIVSALGNNAVEVIDVFAGKMIPRRFGPMRPRTSSLDRAAVTFEVNGVEI